VIELARAMPSVAPGTRVEVLADDPAAASDIPAWCQMRGQDYLGARPLPDGPGAAYLVRRVR
jgi:tRNA 2-thiouridine synthesizing protein A